MLYKKIAKPLFFRMDPEKIHHLTINSLHRAGKAGAVSSLMKALYDVPDIPALRTQICGINLKTPIGLGAGMDKNGQAVPAFAAMGFGFVEVGTVTPKPQPGNDKPRIFRLPDDEALINRMGFNNDGAEAMARHLEAITPTIPIGINIGKNKVTPNEDAPSDYLKCIQTLYPHGDFFIINISSPNTPDLRKLQHGEDLAQLVKVVKEEVTRQNAAANLNKPLFVKLAPDLSDDELGQTVDILLAAEVSGIIATNTTLSREGLTHAHASETGGLSGKPLTGMSTAKIRRIYQLTHGKLPIIGVGGIFSAQDAYDKIRAGASAVEIYTGLVYNGPGIVKRVHLGLAELLQRDGFKSIAEAVGTAD